MKPFLAWDVLVAFGDLAGAKAILATVNRLGQIFPGLQADMDVGSIRDEIEKRATELMTDSERALIALPLSNTLRLKLFRLRECIVNRDKDVKVVEDRISELILDVIIELREPMFLFVPQQDRGLYEQTVPPFGDAVEQRFPEAKRDIAAASRCLALDEWTASVFHSMRVVEHGLHAFATHLGVQFSTPMELENWKNIVDKIEAEVRKLEPLSKSAEKSEKVRTYSRTASQFRYFKDAWRNHVSHGREHYDEREARAIWQHVGDFMQSLPVILHPPAGSSAEAT